MIVKFKDKKETRAVRWVEKATGNDDRPILSGLKVANGKMVAADGWRLHLTDTPDALADHVGKVLRPDYSIYVNPRPQEFTEIEGTFPDYEQIIPNYTTKISFGINKKFLADLKDMPGDEMVKVTINGNDPKASPIVFETEEAKAVIMPMHLE